MKKLVLFYGIIVSMPVFSQTTLPTKKIQLFGGYSRTGSGDLPGFM